MKEKLSDEAIAEARSYVQSLIESKQVEFSSEALSPGTTHQVEVELSGERRLRTERLSAL